MPVTSPPDAPSLGIVDQLLLEDAAREMAVNIAQVDSRNAWLAWRVDHAKAPVAIYRRVPDCPARRKLTDAYLVAAATFARPIPKKARTRGASRRNS